MDPGIVRKLQQRRVWDHATRWPGHATRYKTWLGNPLGMKDSGGLVRWGNPQNIWSISIKSHIFPDTSIAMIDYQRVYIYMPWSSYHGFFEMSSYHRLTGFKLPFFGSSPIHPVMIIHEVQTKYVPSGYVNIAIEHGHRNSGFTHQKWWIFPVRYVKLPEGSPCSRAPEIFAQHSTPAMALIDEFGTGCFCPPNEQGNLSQRFGEMWNWDFYFSQR